MQRKACTIKAAFGDGLQRAVGAAQGGSDRRLLLLQYVSEVEPQVMEQFMEQAPPHVVGAMQQTITNMLGTLPPQFFTVTVSTVGENLQQLMYSLCMTGYMFRNAQYRLDLRNTLAILPPGSSSSSTEAAANARANGGRAATAAACASAAAAAAAISGSEEQPRSLSLASLLDEDGYRMDGYAPGVQKTRVEGDVMRWHKERGLERTPAVQYIEHLERENQRLTQQMRHQVQVTTSPTADNDPTRNELLEYVKALELNSLSDLTSGAGGDVTDAMNNFITRLLGSNDAAQLRGTASNCTTSELAKLMFWLMVVGYMLRTMEVKFEMESSLQVSGGGSATPQQPPPGRLPPGRFA